MFLHVLFPLPLLLLPIIPDPHFLYWVNSVLGGAVADNCSCCVHSFTLCCYGAVREAVDMGVEGLRVGLIRYSGQSREDQELELLWDIQGGGSHGGHRY